MIFIISDNLPEVFIPLDKIIALQMGSLGLKFFYQSAGRTLFMFKVMAEIMFPNLFKRKVPDLI